MIGQTIAHYTITEKIGQGGMGEVYRATDTKLKRDVALKILPESFAQDPQRMVRFQREAEVLASLNHPNIAGIHGLEQEGSTHAIAMELVEGETLAARISKGAIPLEETLKIALQIAEALEAAHEKGIIHRDLKPANVIVTPEGIVKVLDFGLAKAMEPAASSEGDLSQSLTLTMQATQAGIIMGTAAYMSPEQAKGLIADQRSDIWSFGAVSFEMLAGKQPFAGEDITEVLASVVKVDMNWDALPSDVPATVQKWLKRCLRSDPKQRCQAIGDIRLDIQDTLDNPEAESASTVLQPSPPVFWKAPTVWLTVAVTVALTVFATWFLKPTPLIPERPVFRTTIAPARLDTGRINPHVISPDGRVLVYGAAGSLWIRYLDRFYPDPLPDSENTRYAFFSRDSRFLGYGQSGKLWKVHLANGVKSPVCDIPNNYAGATWGTDGSIVFGTFGGGLYQVSDQGGDPRLIREPDRDKGETGFTWPHFLPDQRGIIFSAFRTGNNTIELLIEGNLTTLLSQEDAAFWSPVYSPSGHLIYRRTQSNEGLFAVPFLLSSLEISGDPVPFVFDESIRQDLLSQEDIERRLLLLESKRPYPISRARFTLLSADLALKRETEQAITLLENSLDRTESWLAKRSDPIKATEFAINVWFAISESLATIFLEQGDLAKAAAALEKASLAKTRLISAPSLFSVWLRIRARLARLYRRMGESGEAQKIEDELRQLLVYADPDHFILTQLGQPEADSPASLAR